MNVGYKEYYAEVRNREVDADKETLYEIIDRLLFRIEELETMLRDNDI